VKNILQHPHLEKINALSGKSWDQLQRVRLPDAEITPDRGDGVAGLISIRLVQIAVARPPCKTIRSCGVVLSSPSALTIPGATRPPGAAVIGEPLQNLSTEFVQ
jgi:hypothetical protein